MVLKIRFIHRVVRRVKYQARVVFQLQVPHDVQSSIKMSFLGIGKVGRVLEP